MEIEMRTETTTLYLYDELPTEEAKEKAREWYAGLVFSDSSDWEHVYEDADRIAKMIGIEIGGGTREEPDIMFSGFSSQGDGACFEGSYRYKKGAVREVEKYAPQDAELSRIARSLYQVQRRYFYKLRATCSHSGHYYHSGMMDVEVYHEYEFYEDIGDARDEVRRLLRDFADWIYKQLEREYEYQTSDEQIEEAIRANEYEFHEDGRRACRRA
jgi:hypothetical protein